MSDYESHFRVMLDSHRHHVAQERYWSRPYSSVCDNCTARIMMERCGSTEAAIAELVRLDADSCAPGSLNSAIPHLLVWNDTYWDALNKWDECVTQARKLLAEAVAATRGGGGPMSHVHSFCPHDLPTLSNEDAHACPTF